MRASTFRLRPSGFTLIELMVVLAVIAVLMFVAAPSFRGLMEVQRVKGVSDQFITDVQFARSEAASRQETVGITFKPPGAAFTCYTVHTCGSRAPAACSCNCTAAVGSRCPAAGVADPDPPREIRTVQFPTADRVRFEPILNTGNPLPPAAPATTITFNPATGGLSAHYPTGVWILPVPPNGAFWGRTASTVSGSTVVIRDLVNSSGRPSTCKPSTSSINGIAPC